MSAVGPVRIGSVPGASPGRLSGAIAPTIATGPVAAVTTLPRHIGAAGLAGRDLLAMGDLEPHEIEQVLETSAALKLMARRHMSAGVPLAGRTIALLFERASLRTRVSFELAVGQLGATPIYLGPGDVGLGVRESAADVARTLGRWVDAIVVRTVNHQLLVELADAVDVPVVNGLTDREHPCQALADLLTMREHFGTLAGLRLAFIGEANNVFRSLALAGCAVGMHVRLAHPPGFGPDADLLAAAGALATGSGGSLLVADTPEAAVALADVVYTDTWVSIGDQDAPPQREAIFAPYRVDRRLLAGAPDHAVVMHCLPAHRGEEITADVLDGPRSIAFDQAENRLHAEKGLLAELLPPRVR